MRWNQINEEAISHKDYDLQAKYDHWNKVCFDGLLPRIPLRWGTLKHSLGYCSCKTRIPADYVDLPKILKQRHAELVPNTLNIVLDSKYIREEKDLDAIMIHEMIHAWLFHTGDLFHTHYGSFLDKLRDCERRSGLKIPVTEKVEDVQYADHVDLKKTLIVFLMEIPSQSDPVFAIVNPAAYAKMKEAMRHEWWNRGQKKATLTVYEIQTEAWTKKSMSMPVQRPKTLYGYKGSTKLYYLKDRELLADLKQNGKKLFSQLNEHDD